MACETANGIPKRQEEVNETSASAEQGARKAQASVIGEMLANVRRSASKKQQAGSLLPRDPGGPLKGSPALTTSLGAALREGRNLEAISSRRRYF
jgi:hypothetical protein